MLTRHVALVSLSKKITPTDLTQCAAALQKQITRDLAPIWEISATVDYFPDVDSIPLGYWPIIIVENLNADGAAGFHTDKHHQPFALVNYDSGWQLTCSHELMEMLVDPYGNRLMSAGSKALRLGKVNFLVEVCDPCEDASFAYSINGILVSDFYTPNFFDPQAVPGVRYSYTGSIKKPCSIEKNGYLSWQDPVTKKWYQATWFGGTKPVIKPVKGMRDFGDSLRSQIDRLTKNPNREKAFEVAAKKHSPLQKKVITSGKSKSSELMEEIERFISPKKIAKAKGLTADVEGNTAVLNVSFNSAVGSLTATANRGSGTSDQLFFDSSGGSKSFRSMFEDDVIVVNTIAGSNVDLTIDRNTDPATPMNLSGKATRIFTILK